MSIIAWVLIVVLGLNVNGFALQTNAPSASAQTQTNEAKRAAKAKTEVQKRGAGEKSRVRVSLRNGTEVKGYISKIEESSFEVIANKTGQATSISYTDVKKIQGPGLSTGAKIGIGVAIGIGALALVAWVALSHLKLNL